MGSYIIRKIIGIIPLLLIVSIIMFLFRTCFRVMLLTAYSAKAEL